MRILVAVVGSIAVFVKVTNLHYLITAEPWMVEDVFC